MKRSCGRSNNVGDLNGQAIALQGHPPPPSRSTPRLRVRFVIHDNVGQRTLRAITVDQLKCTPRARCPRPAITTMQGPLHFLAENMFLGCGMLPQVEILGNVWTFRYAQSEMTQTSSSGILCHVHYGCIYENNWVIFHKYLLHVLNAYGAVLSREREREKFRKLSKIGIFAMWEINETLFVIVENLIVFEQVHPSDVKLEAEKMRRELTGYYLTSRNARWPTLLRYNLRGCNTGWILSFSAACVQIKISRCDRQPPQLVGR